MTDVDAAAASVPGDRLTVTFALLLAAAGIVLDQATKIVAERLLEPGVPVPLLGDGIGWQLVYNPGAAFGLPAPPWLFLVVTVLVVVIVVRSLPTTSSLFQAAAYGLLLAGAVGNLLDRVLRADDGFLTGRVVDFVALGSFPRFNVADSCITVGFVLLIGALWHEERRVARTDETPEEAPEETPDTTVDGGDVAVAPPTDDRSRHGADAGPRT